MDAQTLEKLQRIYDQADIFGKSLMEKEFPELKESDDEDIRYFLIRFVKINTGVNISPDYAKKALAWLEKQGAPAKLNEEEQNRIAKGVLSSCAMSFINFLDAHRYEGKMCVSNGECEDIENAFHNAMWDRLHRYYCKFIEKQGEEKNKELPRGEDYGIDSLYHALRILQATLGDVEGYQSDDGILEHECAISAVEELYTQTRWSKKDDAYSTLICSILNVEHPDGLYATGGIAFFQNAYIKNQQIKDWLNSIKQRLTIQTEEESN